ncbi:ATP-binding protein [Iamia sp. SCSIO 61187]|uniref:ATP-binding protein n=1 Tax=Iamia sp. SCSIO 61187 TaxID=2722752 RepID=UPI001C626F3E|nr:ATP-binding protein [Iamia sp. SCSIO 61187]QYG91685.1 ATP-binding protein [Iamia sp. SCSIO 61187]
MGTPERVEVAGEADVARVRAAARDVLSSGAPELVHAAELVATELATNGLLHGTGRVVATVRPVDGGVRIEVGDASRRAPLVAPPSSEGLTGRGLAVVAQLASRWGYEVTGDGKVVWAEVTAADPVGAADAEWSDAADDHPPPAHHHVTLGEVPTDLLVAAKRHVDNLLREFALASMGERRGATAPVPPALAELIERVVHRFAEARVEIKRQATAAARAGATHTALELDLLPEVADAAQEYADALDALDAHLRANRLLTLETPHQHKVFRRWYIDEIVAQLRAAEQGLPPPRRVRFEERWRQEAEAAEAGRVSG